ncbi:MAG: hypothetical protein JW787_04625 [Sedimentisphaerales bacterium]|nr:hypothetical protein [Sedimentisphaerales bacterium]
MPEIRIKRDLKTVIFFVFLFLIFFTKQAKLLAGNDSEKPILVNRYVFLPEQSTIVQAGGIAGVHYTYNVEGQFVLKADFEAGTASFIKVDANAVDDSPYKRTLDPNNVFDMTSLEGVVQNNTTIKFTGKQKNGNAIQLTATLQDNMIHLAADTTPPPDSADFFIYTMDANAKRKYSGGSGEPNEPFQIVSAEDLILLGETIEDYDKNFILTNDINMNPSLPGRKVFANAVIAPDTNDFQTGFQGIPFTGVFDGNRHKILHTAISGVSYLGLFGQTDYEAQLINIGIADANIVGSGDYIGALTGYNRGTIEASFSTGRLNGEQRIGGLAGRNWGSITTSCTMVDVNGYCYVGGLAGDNYGDITRCYSISKVFSDLDAGGLVCVNYGDVNETYSAGIINAGRSAGGLVEMTWEDANTVSSFWDVETSGQTISDGGTGMTTTRMKTGDTFANEGWDFIGETENGNEDIWWILEDRYYPLLWWQLPADDFSDGKAEPLWFVYELEPELAHLEETNGRLEVYTAGSLEDIDAIYAPYNWGLDANKPFAVQVDFHFSKIGTGDGRVNLGIVPSLDPSAMKWAEFEAGTFDDNPFYLYEIRDGMWVDEQTCARFLNEGTLYISYDPNLDELYFSNKNYGKKDAFWTITGLIRAQWQCESIYIILSGGSEDGMALTGADAWLDNFKVAQGTIRQ